MEKEEKIENKAVDPRLEYYRWGKGDIKIIDKKEIPKRK